MSVNIICSEITFQYADELAVILPFLLEGIFRSGGVVSTNAKNETLYQMIT